MLVSDHVVIPGGTGAGRAVTSTSSLKAVTEAIAGGTRLIKLLPPDITPSLERAADDHSFTTSACLMGEDTTNPGAK